MRCPLTGVRLLTLPATHGGPRRHKLHILRFRLWRKLIHFAVAPFPTKAQLLWGPQLSASLGFGGGPIFLPSYPAIFYAAYGRLHLVFKPGGLHP